MLHSRALEAGRQNTCLDAQIYWIVCLDLPIGVRRVAGAGMVTCSVGG
jgi:hypothetical protein